MTHQIVNNTKGRTFFVGDIHGCYDSLMNALSQVNFSPEDGDILVSVGDLVDRGPQNEQVLELLYESWFYTVKGNHEDMMLEAILAGEDSYEAQLWASNGGFWYYSLTHAERGEIDAIVKDRVANLPTVITVNVKNGRKIGVIHAEAKSTNWDTVIKDSSIPAIQQEMLWSRSKANFVHKALKNPSQFIYSIMLQAVENVDAVVFGHTPMKQGPVFCENMAWIDTGAVFGGTMTLIEDKILLRQALSKPSPIQWKYKERD